LTAAFVRAGLSAPAMEVGELIGGGDQAVEPVQLVAQLTVSLASELERYGIARAEEIGAADLYDRMLNEAIEKKATVICRSEIVGWALKG